MQTVARVETDPSSSRMPLRGEGFGSYVSDEAPYFENLSSLDEWADKEHNKLDGVLPYYPRKAVDGIITGDKGKLLVS